VNRNNLVFIDITALAKDDTTLASTFGLQDSWGFRCLMHFH
jgi:hypothetical protein